jgi:hypothetical protein
MRKIFFALIGLLGFLWAGWMAVPDSMIAALIQGLFKSSDISVELFEMSKGAFCTISSTRALIYKNEPGRSAAIQPSRKPILTIQHLVITPDILSFLKFSPRFDVTGQISGGTLHGTFTGISREATADITGKSISIEGLTILEPLGIDGQGLLEFNFQWKKGKGNLTFVVDHADLRGNLAGTRIIPLQGFNRMQGAVVLTDTLTLNSVSLERKGIYIRLKGMIHGNSFNGTMEVIMDASFDQLTLFQTVLKPYYASPGYYVIPCQQVF